MKQKDKLRLEEQKSLVLVRDNLGRYFKFRVWKDRVFIMGRAQEYKNFGEFEAMMLETPCHTIHRAILYNGGSINANASKAKALITLWTILLDKAEDRLDTYNIASGRDVVTGKKKRKSRTGNARYGLTSKSCDDVKMPTQQKVCYNILKDAIGEDKESLSAEEVQAACNNAAKSGILKTKQDPFRIFKYYQSALIKAGLIIHAA